MPFRPLGVCLALGATLLALTLVPGAMSASDSGAAPGAVAIALEYASENADELGVGSADVGDLFVSSAVPGRASGATHVNLNQRFRGLEVFGGSATISVARDGRVFFASGAFVSDLEGASGEADLSATRGGRGGSRRARPRRADRPAGPEPKRRRGPLSRVAASPTRRSPPGSAGSRPRPACDSPGR